MGEFNTATMGGYGSSWLHLGYFGAGNVEPILGSLDGRVALVCGSGEGVFEDFERLYDKRKVVFAANDVGLFLPHVDHFVSHHPGKLIHWAAIRADESSVPVGNTVFKTHTSGKESGIDYQWQGIEPCLPLSGYLAMQIAYLMGAGSIQLLGCQGDGTPRFWDAKKIKRGYGDQGIVDMVRHEMQRLPDFKEKVRSTGGWTAELFGKV